MKQKMNVIHGIEAQDSGRVAGQDQQVHCLTLDFVGYKMLLPNAVVAEVTDLVAIEAREGAPEWFAGMMLWRGQKLPVLILEKLMHNKASTPENFCRLIILNTPNNKGCAPFIALGCQSIPSLTMIEKRRITQVGKNSDQAIHIKLDYVDDYIVPNILFLEEKVSALMKNDE